MNLFKKFYDGFINAGEGQGKLKRSIQNLAIFLIIGIALLLAGGFFSSGDSIKKGSAQKEQQESSIQQQGYLDDYDLMLENKIKGILSEMYGVGKVSVAITYASGKEIVPAKDTKQNQSNTNEKDKEGGVRNTSQVDTDNKIVINEQSEIRPVILKEIPPEVKGVVVVADGARDENIKVDISRAVSTALGISLSKIQVFPRAN